MTEPYLSELRLFPFSFPPRGWAICDGQLLPIRQNQSLYALLGNTYGGDGRNNFALPRLGGRTLIHASDSIRGGTKGGEETHVLSVDELPTHSHGTKLGIYHLSEDPRGNRCLAKSTETNLYAPPDHLVAMAPSMVSETGGGEAHDNMQPYLVLNWCIALKGRFPEVSDEDRR